MIITDKEKFQFKEFCDLDNSPDADYLIKSMDVMSSLECIKRIKQNSIQALYPKKGDFILEAGCGHGEDAEAIAKMVGDTGSVVAIDISQRMLSEAKVRSTQINVDYLFADAARTHFNDNTFSACHADRLLVSHENKEEIFKELVRVVKQEGRISITDVDAVSIVVHPFTRETKIILEQLHKSFVNPMMGRELISLFTKYQLKNIEVVPHISIVRDYETLTKIFQFTKIIAEAIKEEYLTDKEAEGWIKIISEANRKNEFIYSITLFNVSGSKA